MATFAPILAAAVALSAPSVGLAQAVVSQPQAERAAQPPAKPEAPPTPLSGLIVQAPKRKACSEKDKACQTAVIEEIWRRFPKEIETWCTAVQTRRTRERFALQDLLGDDQLAISASSDFNSALPEPEKRLCQPAFKAKFVDAPFAGKGGQAAAAAVAPPPGASAK